MKFSSFKLSSVLFLIVLASVLSSASPSICHQVLLPATATSASLPQLIKQLAEMKLELDTSQVSGDADPIHSVLNSLYPKLFAEVLLSHRDSYSEPEIVSMIKQEILDLQGKGRTEKRQAEIEKEILSKVPYTLKEAGQPAPLSLVNSKSGSFFLPEREMIYALRGDSLHASDLTGQSKIIASAEAMSLIDNGASLLLKNGDKMMTITTDNNQIRSSYEITFRSTENAEASFESLEVSPDRGFALLKGPQADHLHRNLSIIDLNNHNEVFHHGKLSAPATDAVIIDNKHIAVLYENEKIQLIEIVEIPSGKVIQFREATLDEQGRQTAQLAVSKNGARLAVFNDKEILSFQNQNLSLKPRSLKVGKEATINRSLMQASGYPHHLLETDYNSSSNGRLIDLETMTVAFDFQGKYGQDHNLVHFVPSPDGQIILAHYSQQEGTLRRYKLDVWEKDFFQIK